jgi:Concanavalin A-like lectin/glucanases superfamily
MTTKMAKRLAVAAIAGATIASSSMTLPQAIFAQATPSVPSITTAAVNETNVLDDFRTFDGIKDSLSIPNSPNLNFGTGDLTISAWIKTSRTNGIDVILDKRVESSGPVQGYHLVNYSGRLLLQLADGQGPSQWTNFDSGVSIADGKLHHIAVTVSRSLKNGGHWYLDGKEVGTPFDPTVRPGSLDNTMPLIIGNRSDSPNSPGFFQGDIGKIKLFQRALSPQEIAGLAGTTDDSTPMTPLEQEVAKLTGQPKPQIVGTEFLTEAGMSNPSELFSVQEHNCPIDVKAKWPSGSATGRCVYTAPKSWVVVKGDVTVEEKQRTCSKVSDEFTADGVDLKSKSEIEQIYGRAIELAIKAGKIDVSVKLGQMRDYHLNLYSLYADRGSHIVVVSAKAGLVRRAICGGNVRDLAIRM